MGVRAEAYFEEGISLPRLVEALRRSAKKLEEEEEDKEDEDDDDEEEPKSSASRREVARLEALLVVEGRLHALAVEAKPLQKRKRTDSQR
jgi:hypothetical protein